MKKHVFSCNFMRNIANNDLFYKKMTKFASDVK